MFAVGCSVGRERLCGEQMARQPPFPPWWLTSGRTGQTVDLPYPRVAGEEDSQFPVHAVRSMADAIEGSTFRVLPHTGHLAARENPEEVNATIDAFLGARLAA